MKNKEETFLLVSLEEDKAKKLAQVISNDTCRKILDYLAAKKSTETELAQALTIPLPTVHYNLKHLVDARLVDAEEFHYSEKGREVLHYSISNKYVIIAPKGASQSIKDKLKSLIGALVSVGAIAFAIQFVPKIFGSVGATKMAKAAPMAAERLAEAAPAVTEQAVETVASAGNITLAKAAEIAAAGAGNATTLAQATPPAQQFAGPLVSPQTVQIIQPFYQQAWFLIIVGALLCVILFLLFEYMRKRDKE